MIWSFLVYIGVEVQKFCQIDLIESPRGRWEWGRDLAVCRGSQGGGRGGINWGGDSGTQTNI